MKPKSRSGTQQANDLRAWAGLPARAAEQQRREAEAELADRDQHQRNLGGVIRSLEDVERTDPDRFNSSGFQTELAGLKSRRRAL